MTDSEVCSNLGAKTRRTGSRPERVPRVLNVLVGVSIVLAGLMACSQPSVAGPLAKHAIGFTARTGGYTVSFNAARGAIAIRPPGKSTGLTIREIPGSKPLDLLYSVGSISRSGSTYTLLGRSSWSSFNFVVELVTAVPGLIHLKLTMTPKKSPPAAGKFIGDVQIDTGLKATLKEYAPAPPVAGTSVMVSSTALHSTILYFADLTSLGSFFDRTGGGATFGVFRYPNAGTLGGLVGVVGNRSFGYPVSAGDLGRLPHGKATTVLDSYLYLLSGVPAGEAAVSETYLKMLGAVYDAMPKASIPAADWSALAGKEAANLLDPANLVTVDGKQYLRAYVSDTRSAPELITEAGVLAGVKAYEAKSHQSLPIDAVLEQGLSSFYDPQYHSIVNGLGHDPKARGESWYFVTNMISLLQLAQLGDGTAKQLLLDSTGAVESLAHVNGYEFPQSFSYSTWDGKGTGVQADVAGGYAWLMLGLYDLTNQQQYLSEAEASIAHVEGKGFGLSYETHMTAFAAAAAQRLYGMTGDVRYRGDALLALANLFHATRLWDCTYGACRKGAGYHTYFGLNPLPWSDYVAMLEQYEAWLGLRDYMTYAAQEPSYVKDLVQGFLTETPLTMQYSLPPQLAAGVATTSPGEYAFVPRNNLAWDIPLEDLRTGEQNSGLIGQEIYGAGGPFMLAAYSE
jgi:hypothetical protein